MSVGEVTVFCFCFGMFFCVLVVGIIIYKSRRVLCSRDRKAMGGGVTSLPPHPITADGCRTPFDSHPLCCRLPVCRVVFLGNDAKNADV